MKPIGPAFPDDLRANGLLGLPFSWQADGMIVYGPEMTPGQIAAVKAVYTAHDPTKAAPASPLAQALDAALQDPSVSASLKSVLLELRKQRG